MIKILFKSFIMTIFIFSSNLYSQYFLIEPAPLQPGNYWLYMSDFGRVKGYCKILDSTIKINSIEYFVVETKAYLNGSAIEDPSYTYKRMDSDGFYYSRSSVFGDTLGIYYKKDAVLNDSWINTFLTGEPAYYEIIDTGTYNWLDNFGKYKLLRITDNKLVEEYQYWSEEFGILQAYDFESSPDYLIGCVINGITYGDTTVVSVDDDETLPQNIILYQNYPNPFNPTTNIKFSLPETDFITLKIFDIIGREIETIAEKEMQAGFHSIKFYSKNLSAGIYLCVLKTSKYYSAIKMTLLK